MPHSSFRCPRRPGFFAISPGLLVATLWILMLATPAIAADPPRPASPPKLPETIRTALTRSGGHWSGVGRYGADSTDIHLQFVPKEDGQVTLQLTLPVTNLFRVPLGPLVAEGNGYRAAVLAGHFESGQARFVGTINVSGRETSFDLSPDTRPVPGPVPPVARPTTRDPAWSFHTGAPLWSSPTIHDRLVYFGGGDGRIYAVDADNGTARWQFQTAGPVMARPTIQGDHLYVASDDGWLYKLDARSGSEVWRFDTHGGSVKRVLPSLTVEGYDYLASAALVADGTVYVGSADGKLYAVDDPSGRERWSFSTKGIIRSTPVLADGVVIFGSHDHFVYAVNARSGALAWKHDKFEPVVSSPSLDGDQVLIGGRDALLEALAVRDGSPRWGTFYWYSWVESSATLVDGTAYIGSSDYQRVLAIDPRNGQVRWWFDTDGSAWSTPAVDSTQVYIGAVGTPGYMIDHRGGFFALDRATGRELWRSNFQPAPGSFTSGVASSPAVGRGKVYFGGLDGTFRAVEIR